MAPPTLAYRLGGPALGRRPAPVLLTGPQFRWSMSGTRLQGILPTKEPLSRRPVLKVHEIIGRLEQDGWRLVRTRGSHRQFRHSSKPGTVTVSGKPSMDLRPGTLNSILRQAGLK
jgi:predicted RNA binding protein YcfA (HicA-like mRNA interferase family)